MKFPFSHIIRVGCYLGLGYFVWLMWLITLQYVPIRLDVAFLQLKEDAISQVHYQVAFFSHVYTSIFVLMLGITQFSGELRRRLPELHRGLGKGYVLLILSVASPSGLVMAWYANGGLSSQVSFSLQAILWFAFTWIALQRAKQRDWRGHHHFMLRSYALTLSAVSLRLFKWIIVSTLAWPPMDTYRL
ncbi:MAG: DUF2306 domain-containing protein, partial [Bacteroidota bacterium]